jgi:hypothetical protein
MLVANTLVSMVVFAIQILVFVNVHLVILEQRALRFWVAWLVFNTLV